jgi:hypothetical protein
MLKDGNPGGADAGSGIIGRFKVNAGDGHRGWQVSRLLFDL